MLERVEDVIAKNDIDYEIVGSVINLKLGRAGGKVTIKYDYATNSYRYNCNEYMLGLSSLIFFVMSFNTMYHPEQQTWSGYVAGMMFSVAIFNLVNIVLAHIQILDLKAQLREVGVYLKSAF